ncbi:MAG: Alpha/Beta hydrolase protein [Benniella sp.]|nr:MAG: Alpha/Beta hydrolase protein [Benniella sp.]
MWVRVFFFSFRFYWYFPAIKPKAEDPPLLIWFQGGPGSTSLIGLFYENGPIQVNDKLKLERREFHWAEEYSIVFIDQPVGTGYSYIRTRASLYSNGYVKDQRGVVSDMLIFLDQFYLRFPEIRNKDLYITGESYGGKFVPAYDMDSGDKDRCQETRPPTEFVFPLKGIAMGNGLSDPVSQIQVHADQCYYAGVITKAHADQMRALQDIAVKEVEAGRFLAANQYRLGMFDVFRNATGGLNWYDIRKGSVPNDWTTMELFVNSDPVKDALNVFGPRMATQHAKDTAVLKAMEGDIMRSSVWMISSLLQQGIKVLIYQGMFDFRDGPAGSHHWVDQLEWPGQAEFLKTERELWKNDMGRLAGYVTQVPGLSRVTILGAGHLAMMDQSKNSLTMISSFIEDKKLGDPTSED